MTTKKTGKKNPFRIINRALRDAKVKKLGVNSESWGVIKIRDDSGISRWAMATDCACPLGLCLVGKKAPIGESSEVAACKLLGQTRAWVRSFIDGVDNNAFNSSCEKKPSRQAFNFGRRLREKLGLHAP